MRRLFLLLAATGVVALKTGAAQAYVRTKTQLGNPMYWDNRCISATVFTGTPPRHLGTGQFLPMVQAAVKVWTHESLRCTDIDVKFVPSSEEDGDVAFDGHNNIMFRRAQWCRTPRPEGEPCYDSMALAVTSVFAGNSDGRIKEADIELNAVNFTWADRIAAGIPDGDLRDQDVQNALAHEFGHFIGLDHTCYLPGDRPRPTNDLGNLIPDCSPAVPMAVQETTMYASVIKGDTSRRDLGQDDQNAVCGVYPAPPEAPPACSPANSTVVGTIGCALGGGARCVNQFDGRWLALLMGLGAALRRRRGTTSQNKE